LGKVYYAMLTAAFALVLFPLVSQIGAAYEGRLWPVVTGFEIIEVTPGPTPLDSTIYVHFDKQRNCEYVGISWDWKSGGTYVRVPVILNPPVGSAATRPLGKADAGPWVVQIPPEKIRGSSRVTLNHRCSLLYITQTEVYP
jgi:hypothetical protein